MDSTSEFIIVAVLVVCTGVGLLARFKWGFGQNPRAMLIYVGVAVVAAGGITYVLIQIKGDSASSPKPTSTASSSLSSKGSDEGFCNARQLFSAIKRKAGHWNRDFRCKAVDWSDPATLLVVIASALMIGSVVVWFAIRTWRSDDFED